MSLIKGNDAVMVVAPPLRDAAEPGVVGAADDDGEKMASCCDFSGEAGKQNSTFSTSCGRGGEGGGRGAGSITPHTRLPVCKCPRESH